MVGLWCMPQWCCAGKIDVRQGVNLKLSGVERLTDKFIEKKRIN